MIFLDDVLSYHLRPKDRILCVESDKLGIPNTLLGPTTCMAHSEFLAWVPDTKFDLIVLGPINAERGLPEPYPKCSACLAVGGALLTVRLTSSKADSDEHRRTVCSAGFYMQEERCGDDAKVLRYRKRPRIDWGGPYVVKEWHALHERILKKVFDRNAASKLLLAFADAMKDRKYMLGFGTLLGAIREKDFIAYDTDVDVIIPEKYCEGIHKTLSDAGLAIGRVLRFGEERGDLLLSVMIPGNEAYLDTYAYLDEFGNRHSFAIPGRHELADEDMEMSSISFLGRMFPIPANPERVLTKWYRDWKTPICSLPYRKNMRY
jgi:hypothetical protein